MNLRGIFAALIACYGDDGELSLERQEALIDHLFHEGLEGIFVSGSTGESFLQHADERRETIAAAVKQTAGRGAVIAHTGSIDEPTTLQLTEHAVSLGVDAVSAITPIYFNYTPSEHARFYRELARSAQGTPVIAYHIPGNTHAQLPPEFFIRLADEGVIQGVKYTATDLYPIAEIIRRTPPEFIVYNGNDEVLLGGLALGAHGGIGSTYNVLGPLYTQLRDAVVAGDLAKAREAQWTANCFIESMNNYNFLAFLREVLRFQGLETGLSRRPLPHLTREQQQAVQSALEAGRIAGVPIHERP